LRCIIKTMVTEWKKAAELVRARRDNELGLTVAEAVARSGGLVSLSVWDRFENLRGTGDFKRSTLKGICAALEWRGDAFDLIAAGEVPVAIDPAAGEDDDVVAAIRRSRRLRLPENRDLLTRLYETLARSEGA
jgi:hypothetical protein